MQAHTHKPSDKSLSSPPLSGMEDMDALKTAQQTSPEAPAPVASSSVPTSAEEPSKLDQSLTTLRETLDGHKGKLAISAAAMLGLLIYYKWGEKSLAKEDPAEYERLRRIKEGLRHAEHGRRAGDKPHQSASEKKA